VSFEDIKREVAIGNRVLAHVGLCTGVTATLGHVSLRIPESPDLFIVKGRGYEVDAIPAMKAADMIVCDLDGNKVDGPPKATQCFEVKIHSAIYKMYPDVKSVVHVHPRHAIMMSVIGAPIVPMCQEGMALVRRPLPLFPHYRLVSSDEDGNELAKTLAGRPAALLIGHGAVTTGSSIASSILNMMNLEEQARLNWLATCAVGPDHPGIPEELLQEADDMPPYWTNAHFASSVPADDPRRQGGFQSGANSGPYDYWASLVEDGV